MSAPPLPARPAATVMLIRDTDEGLDVFLMRRRRSMDFAGGMVVFPGGGVDQRDYDADIAWHGPPPSWWAQRLGVDEDLARALVCAAARETFEECGVLFAGAADDPDLLVDDARVYKTARAALAEGTLSFSDFLRDESLMLRADLLRPWSNWVTPVEERTRRYDTYFFVAAMPDGQLADGDNTESDHADWSSPEAALADFVASRNMLMPPTWCQLDSLTGRSVEEVLAVERDLTAIEPKLTVSGDNWDIEFFDSERYNAARGGRTP
ncbi:hypothetical protein MBRU_16350 [Mycolicibacterium brumae DSM 44177]|nr:hypothetical protein MBRU_16350 [Mycolicibacterium brumae DSM 44177]